MTEPLYSYQEREAHRTALGLCEAEVERLQRDKHDWVIIADRRQVELEAALNDLARERPMAQDYLRLRRIEEAAQQHIALLDGLNIALRLEPSVTALRAALGAPNR